MIRVKFDTPYTPNLDETYYALFAPEDFHDQQHMIEVCNVLGYWWYSFAGRVELSAD